MWPTKRKASGLEALVGRLRARQWKTEAERDELLKTLAAAPNLAAEDVALDGGRDGRRVAAGGPGAPQTAPVRGGRGGALPFPRLADRGRPAAGHARARAARRRPVPRKDPGAPLQPGSRRRSRGPRLPQAIAERAGSSPHREGPRGHPFPGGPEEGLRDRGGDGFAPRDGDRPGGPRRRRRGPAVPRRPAPLEVSRRDADPRASRPLPQRLDAGQGRGDRGPRPGSREVAEIVGRRRAAAALGHQSEGATARLADHRHAGSGPHRRRIPPDVQGAVRPGSRPGRRGPAGAESRVHPGLPRARRLGGSARGRARRVDRGDHPLRRGRPALPAVPDERRLVAARPRGDGAGRDPRRGGPSPAPRDALGPGVQPFGGRGPGRLGDSQSPSRAPGGVQAIVGVRRSAPGDPRRVRTDPGPEGRPAPPEDRPGRSEPPRPREGDAARPAARGGTRRRAERIRPRFRPGRLRVDAEPVALGPAPARAGGVGVRPAPGDRHGAARPDSRPPGSASAPGTDDRADGRRGSGRSSATNGRPTSRRSVSSTSATRTPSSAASAPTSSSSARA